MRIITFFISIVIVYLLVSLFGAPGAAIGLIIGQTIFMLLLHLITQTHNGGISSIFTDIRMLVLVIPAFISGLFVQSLFENEIIILLSSSVIFFLIVMISGFFSGLLETPQMIIKILIKYFPKLENKFNNNF